MGSKEEVVYIIPILRGDNQALPGVTHYLKIGSKLKLLTIVTRPSVQHSAGRIDSSHPG